ncbi:hypothetical protein SAMN04488085_107181 [Geodermatophilus ruber]|uniref:Uncharacterized protein n=1 Tax=Geodermatophilus ruber TaxID=504800 RepID=A0A1I4FKY0_9ACTN|nr:hypothetical protein SAMN04488085_107181 [Geodermatophilus ruber]
MSVTRRSLELARVVTVTFTRLAPAGVYAD